MVNKSKPDNNSLIPGTKLVLYSAVSVILVGPKKLGGYYVVTNSLIQIKVVKQGRLPTPVDMLVDI